MNMQCRYRGGFQIPIPARADAGRPVADEPLIRDGQSTLEVDAGRLDALRTLTMVVYALQALSFVLGVTFIAAAIVNYVKRSEVNGTWLASHFRWQLRTFWYGLLWGVLGFITSFILVGYVVLLGNAIWLIYRIVRGWLRAADRQPMYA